MPALARPEVDVLEGLTTTASRSTSCCTKGNTVPVVEHEPRARFKLTGRHLADLVGA